MNLSRSSQAIVVSRRSLYSSPSLSSSDEKSDIEKEKVKKQLFERLESEIQFIDHGEVDTDPKDHRVERKEEEQVFKLFAQTPPTKISLESNDIKEYNIWVKERYRLKDDNETSEDTDREARIQSVTLTPSQILSHSKISWETHFFPKRVLHIPSLTDQRTNEKRRTRRKSKKRRDKEKLVLLKNKSFKGWPDGGPGYAYGWRNSGVKRGHMNGSRRRKAGERRMW